MLRLLRKQRRGTHVQADYQVSEGWAEGKKERQRGEEGDLGRMRGSYASDLMNWPFCMYIFEIIWLFWASVHRKERPQLNNNWLFVAVHHLLQIQSEKATFSHRSNSFLSFLSPFKRAISSTLSGFLCYVVGLEKQKNKCFKGHKRSTSLSGVFDFSQTQM